MKLPIILAIVGLINNALCDDKHKVSLKGQGVIEGLPLTSRGGRQYLGFLGVPFGKVSERFAPSDKPDKWEGTKEVKVLPEVCMQYSVFTHTVDGNEDCLKVNVYTPKLKSDKKYPVLVWFSPGGFIIGGASLFEGKYFMDQDVVLVTVNNRMGALGFLNTADGVVGGNMGLKDQTLALEWVKEHISSFSGDENLVTIFGLSAGGAAVEYHLVSELSKGLFHRAISFSGSILSPWAFQQNPKKLSVELGEKAGCTKGTSEELVKCLRSLDAEKVVQSQKAMMKLGVEMDWIHMKFVPSVESTLKGPKFMTNTPWNILKKGQIVSKVPWIIGYVENEGSLYIADMIRKPEIISRINENWNEVAPEMFYYKELFDSPSEVDKASEKIRSHYFGKDKLSFETRRGLSNIYGDRFFNNHVSKAILLHKDIHDVYPYFFDLKGKHSLIQYCFKDVKDTDGMAHADDLMYLFNKTFLGPEIEKGTKDGQFSETFIKFVVDFAITGKPKSWVDGNAWRTAKELVVGNKLKMHRLEFDSVSLVNEPYESRRKFWDDLGLKEHSKDPQHIKIKDEL